MKEANPFRDDLLVAMAMKKTIIITLLLFSQYMSAAQNGSDLFSDKSFDCASDSMTWGIIKSLKKSGTDSIIILCHHIDGEKTTEHSITSILWPFNGKIHVRSYSGCSRINYDTSFTRQSDSSFSFYQDNKIHSIFTHIGLGHDDCKDSCICSMIMIFLPGESNSYLSKKCSIEHQNAGIIESNSGMSRETAIQLLQKWVTIIKDD